MFSIKPAFTRAAEARPGVSLFVLILLMLIIDDDRQRDEQERRKKRERNATPPRHRGKPHAGPRPW